MVYLCNKQLDIKSTDVKFPPYICTTNKECSPGKKPEFAGKEEAKAHDASQCPSDGYRTRKKLGQSVVALLSKRANVFISSGDGLMTLY